jgi:hypothetical protein
MPKVRVSLSIDEEMRDRVRELAGLVSFSRYVQSIIAKEIKEQDAKEVQP